MTNPTVLSNLETAWDELDMARQSIQAALEHAQLCSLPSTYTTPLTRLLAFNQKTINSMGRLLTRLKRLPTQVKP